MNRYPLFLNLKGKKAAVFGAGRVALRKIKLLLQSGAQVEVSSRDYLKEVRSLAKRYPKLRLRPNGSISALLKNAGLAFAATSDSELNERIAHECHRKKIWVNVADSPALSDFFVPAYFKKGRLELAISTGGTSPLLAKKLREELAKKIRPEALRLLNRMNRFRGVVLGSFASQKARRRFLEEKIGKDFHFLSARSGGNPDRS